MITKNLIDELTDVSEIGYVIEEMKKMIIDFDKSDCDLKDLVINGLEDDLVYAQNKIDKLSLEKSKRNKSLLFEDIYDEGFEEINVSIDYISDGNEDYKFYCIRVEISGNREDELEKYLNESYYSFISDYDVFWIF